MSSVRHGYTSLLTAANSSIRHLAWEEQLFEKLAQCRWPRHEMPDAVLRKQHDVDAAHAATIKQMPDVV